MNADDLKNNPFTDPTLAWTNKTLHTNRQLSLSLFFNVILTVAVIILTVIGVYQALFLRPAPYVLKVDELNRVEFGGYLDQKGSNMDELLPSQLMRFIDNWRTVTPDQTLQKKLITNLYCMIPHSAASRTVLNEYFREDKNNPFKISENYSITTKISTLLKLSAQTWSVEWLETSRSHDGTLYGDPIRYKANFRIAASATKMDCLEGNPLGLYVNEFNWTAMQ